MLGLKGRAHAWPEKPRILKHFRVRLKALIFIRPIRAVNCRGRRGVVDYRDLLIYIGRAGLDKSAFKQDTRYTITWHKDGKERPGNIYVYRCYDNFMIARQTEGAGFLHKIPYTDVVRIVKEHPVDNNNKFFIPAAVLDEKSWKDRTVMERYSSSPHMGK